MNIKLLIINIRLQLLRVQRSFIPYLKTFATARSATGFDCLSQPLQAVFLDAINPYCPNTSHLYANYGKSFVSACSPGSIR